MIRLFGDLVINPRLVESMAYNEKGRPCGPTLTILMASGAIHLLEGSTCEEIYNRIMRVADDRSVTVYPAPPNGPPSL